MAEDNHRHLAIGELAQGEHAAMPGDDLAIWVDQNRIVESKLGDAGGDLCDLGRGMGAGIAGIGNQAFYGPRFDLKFIGMGRHGKFLLGFSFETNEK